MTDAVTPAPAALMAAAMPVRLFWPDPMVTVTGELEPTWIVRVPVPNTRALGSDALPELTDSWAWASWVTDRLELPAGAPGWAVAESTPGLLELAVMAWKAWGASRAWVWERSDWRSVSIPCQAVCWAVSCPSWAW